MKRWRLILLLLILAGLLVWLWIVGHKPSPAYPESQFVHALLETALVLAITCLVASFVKARTKKEDAPEKVTKRSP